MSRAPLQRRRPVAKAPAWLTVARSRLGTREAAGAANSPVILGWAMRLGIRVLGMIYNADSVPWCDVFVASCLADDGIAGPPVAVRATSWAAWGQALRPERLAPGAVLVFERPGGGHVGFYVGEDHDAYHCLGGNQGDAVTIVRIARARCIARRWPQGRPVMGKPVRIAVTNGALSRDEA